MAMSFVMESLTIFDLEICKTSFFLTQYAVQPPHQAKIYSTNAMHSEKVMKPALCVLQQALNNSMNQMLMLARSTQVAARIFHFN
jgi:hypothetical protein